MPFGHTTTLNSWLIYITKEFFLLFKCHKDYTISGSPIQFAKEMPKVVISSETEQKLEAFSANFHLNKSIEKHRSLT